MIRFIYARDARILEKNIFDKIQALLAEPDQKGILIVPSQSTFLMEQRILKECNVKGFMNLEVLSFEKLTERLLDELGGSALPTIDRAGVSMLVKNALFRTKLKKIDPRDETIHEALTDLICSLKRENISAQELEKLARDSDRELTKDKLLDIAGIYRQTAEQMRGVWDRFDLQDTVIRELEEDEGFRVDQIFVHGFDIYSEQRFALLERLLERVEEATVTFLLPPGKEWDNPIYTREIRNARRLEEIADREGKEVLFEDLNPKEDREMVRLAANFYAYPYSETKADVQIISTKDMRGEVYQLAAGIVKELRRGKHPRNIAVLAAAPEQYVPYIDDIFTRAEIPFFMDIKRSLLENPYSIFLLTILDLMIYRQRSYDILRLIKSGYLDLTPREMDILTAYQKIYGIKGYQWKSPFHKGDFEEAETLRQKAVAPVLKIIEAYRAKSPAKDGILVLRALIEKLEIREKLEEQARQAGEADLSAQKLYIEQVFEEMETLLEQAEHTLDGTQTIKELREILATGFASQSVAVIPPMTDQVLVGDLKRSIAGEIDTLYLIGVNDGILPWGDQPGDFFTTPEVTWFRETVGAFPGDMDQDEQKYYLLRALALPKERLVLSFQENETKRPSWIIQRMERICGVHPEKGKEEIHTFEAGLRPLAQKLRESIQTGTPCEIGGEWREARECKRLQDVWRAAGFANEAEGIGDYTRALYGKLSGSASFIERYYQCPYRHFLDYAIRPEQRREFDEEAVDIGNYIHELLDRFTKEIRKSGRNWAELTDEEIETRIRQEAHRIRDEHNRGIFRETEFSSLEKRLSREAAEAAKAIRHQLQGTQIQVAGSEISFGQESEPVAIEMPDGTTISLKGKIDRVDIAPVNGEQMARIVDYKTSKKAFNFTDFYYGIGIQLIVYLRAVQEFYKNQGKEVTPAGSFYFNIQLPFLEQGAAEEERYKEFRMSGFIRAEEGIARAFDARKEGPLLSMELNIKKDGTLQNQETAYQKEEMRKIMDFANRLVIKAARKITQGEIPVKPYEKEGKKCCALCDYRAVCRFDEHYGKNKARILTQKTKADLTDGE